MYHHQHLCLAEDHQSLRRPDELAKPDTNRSLRRAGWRRCLFACERKVLGLRIQITRVCVMIVCVLIGCVMIVCVLIVCVLIVCALIVCD